MSEDKDLLEGFNTVRVYLEKRKSVCESYAKIRFERDMQKEAEKKALPYEPQIEVWKEWQALDMKIAVLKQAFEDLREDVEYLSDKAHV